MGIEKQSKTIGEFTYEVSQFGAKLGNRVLLKVIRSIAPLFLAAAAAGDAKAMNQESIASALAGVSEDDFEWLVDQFAAATDVIMPDGKQPGLKSIYDVHFAGRYLDELEWIQFVLEVNFGPFFQELKRKAGAKLAKKAPSSSPSPTT